MGDSLFVQEIQTGGNLLDDLGRFVLGKADVLLDPGQQLAAIDLVGEKGILNNFFTFK